jgi:hypothetical protein
MSNLDQTKITQSATTSVGSAATDVTQQATSSKLNVSSDLAYKEKIIYKNRFGPNLFRISTSYLLIVAIGITTFYFAKKEVDQERQHSMLVKKEITENKSYPNRGELIKAERAELLKKQNQL